MKQNMKRLWLMLCMVACLFSLSACTAADTSQNEVDAEVSMMLSVGTPALLNQMVEMTDAQLQESITALEKEKNYVYYEGLTNWLTVKEETGAFQEIVSTTVSKAEHGYSCIVVAQFAERAMEFKVLVDEDINVTTMSFTPEYTVSEKMVKAALNTLMGMGTVFAVLIFIIFIISLFKYINVWENKMKANSEPEVPVSPPAAVPAAFIEEEELVDDLELVAVITAAIAASANTSTDGLVVRSIKRASGAKWKKA